MFERQRDFDEVIHHPGEEPEPPPRPWTRLRNDPRVEAFIGASLEELHERNRKAEQKKQVDAQVRQASADLGVPVGQVRVGADDAKDAEVKESMREAVDPGHDSKKAEAAARDDMHTAMVAYQKDQSRDQTVNLVRDHVQQPGSFPEQLFMYLIGAYGKHWGTALGALVGAHFSQRANLGPGPTHTVIAASGVSGGLVGKKGAKRMAEEAMKSREADPPPPVARCHSRAALAGGAAS